MSMRKSVLNLGRYPPSRLIDLARLQEDCGYETFWYADESHSTSCTTSPPCTSLT
jgi:alkanesulfonate monooxygenase SsuD/methylene tetrahydromethanopterin reductase-like flavin-dependent oxidoreductase (luciferase family)